MIQPLADPTETPQGPPSLLELFVAFFGISIIGFGGVLPFAQRMLVEQRRWLTVTEFAETLALAQFLPGGNILNVSVAVGQRFRGPLGSIAAVTGLVAGPTAILIALGVVYEHYGQIAGLQSVLTGIAAAAAGLIISMVAKLAWPIFRLGDLVPIAFAVAAFSGVIALELPLLTVLAILGPLSVAYYWWRLP